jgi:signal peptidase
VGIQPLKVLSGSMEPNIPVGSLLYITKADPDELKVGDPITFQIASAVEAPNSIAKDPDQVGLCTHRIVDIIRDEDGRLWFRTKGDANDVSDAYIAANRIEGVYLCHIPVFGYVAHFVQTPPGSYVTIMIALLVILFMMAPDMLDSFFRKDEEENKAAPADAAPDADAPAAPAPEAAALDAGVSEEPTPPADGD